MDISLDVGEYARFIGMFSLGRDSGMGSLHFVRLKVPAGILSADRLRGVAELSREFGRGYAEITDRQDIQLHWIEADDALKLFSRMDELGFTTDMCGQAFSGAGHGDVRNVVVCPLSGKVGRGVHNHAIELTRFFSGNREFLDMPKKFKMAFTACGTDCVRVEINDLSFVGVNHEGEEGYALMVGGGAGKTEPGPRIAEPMGVFVPEDKVFDVALSLVRLHRDRGCRESKSKARFKYLVDTWGLSRIRTHLESEVGPLEEIAEMPALSSNVHEGEGIQDDGRHYLTLPLPGGVTSAEQLETIAALSEQYGSGELRLTPSQNITFVDVDEPDALRGALWARGLWKDVTPSYYTSIGCASDFCGKTREVHAKELMRRVVGLLEREGVHTRVFVSGCQNGCCAHQLAPIGFMGRGSTYDIFVGGRLGMGRMGRRVATGLTPAQCVDAVRELVEQYREGGYDGFEDMLEHIARTVEVEKGD